ncbi:MAG: hypothetical protein AB7S68_09115, partial [Polyangiaceae bacterium]
MSRWPCLASTPVCAGAAACSSLVPRGYVHGVRSLPPEDPGVGGEERCFSPRLPVVEIGVLRVAWKQLTRSR